MASMRAQMIALLAAALFPALALAVEVPPGMPGNLQMKQTDAGLVFVDDQGSVLYVEAGASSRCEGFCAEAWPPLIAPAGYQAQGDWGVVERFEGDLQLTFQKLPLHRFVTQPDGRLSRGWGPLLYMPPTPPHVVPSGIELQWLRNAFVYVDGSGRPLFTGAKDCGDCGEGVRPLPAPMAALAVGDWRPEKGKDGGSYWTFKGQPVYVRVEGEAESAASGLALLTSPS